MSVQVDFDALARINPDVKAWIYIKGTGINYPIVQTTDNTSYLHRTFEGKDSFIGAIFLDAGCEADFSSENSIVYGHNLNGQMFGMLKKHYDAPVIMQMPIIKTIRRYGLSHHKKR